MEKDAIFETAERYVRFTGRSIFLTGKAGTGKTTFLKYITQSISKRFVILAPTGVAAINAGGSTIHSFFQLPLCPYLPDVKELITEYQMPERYRRLRKERLKIIRTLDLLIIDEISMVRADLLDAVDMSLRHYRRSSKPFGGVQLLMIGDAHQLSPVVKENERQYMAQVYPSPYFFHSKALQKLDYITIELQKVHRQKDADFLEILNAVREDRITHEVLQKLNSRVNAFDSESDVIRLTTHNSQADQVNSSKLAKLPGDPVMFEAEVEGEFPENSYPADSVLSLKKGAQVMFVRNDPEGRFYNGKIGIVESITDRGLITVTDQDGESIAVEPVDWENIEYALDESSGEIMPEVIGKFRQLPLRIAWAVTIHKSQGLTFDNVIIDAGAAFAFGQVYVALSRCRTLEGISLENPIRPSAIYSDSHVAVFNAGRQSLESVRSALDGEERRHTFDLLKDIFGIGDMVKALTAYRKAWAGTMEQLYPSEYQRLIRYQIKAEDLRKTGDTFRIQLTRIEGTPSEDDSYLNERIRKASEYYLPIVEEIRKYCIVIADLEVDNKEVKKRLKEDAEELFIQLDILCQTFESIIAEGFSIEKYGKIRTECQLEDRTKARKRLRKIIKSADTPSTVNEELREKLQEWRTERFKADNVPAYTIMHQSTLIEIASLVPKTMTELLSIKGFGKAKCEKYGQEILEITSKY
ncbi:MAG: HRDC domain-containing protein [Bacteroidales bacterium]|nr:HRDC domain-containing protein [Bacteroidales bacterium]